MEEREDEGRRAGEGEGAWLQLAARGGGVTWVCRTRSERRRRESTRRASGRRLLRRRGKRSELSHLALEEGEALGDFGHQLVVVHRLRLPMRSGGGRRGGVGAGRGGLGNSLRSHVLGSSRGHGLMTHCGTCRGAVGWSGDASRLLIHTPTFTPSAFAVGIPPVSRPASTHRRLHCRGSCRIPVPRTAARDSRHPHSQPRPSSDRWLPVDRAQLPGSRGSNVSPRGPAPGRAGISRAARRTTVVNGTSRSTLVSTGIPAHAHRRRRRLRDDGLCTFGAPHAPLGAPLASGVPTHQFAARGVRTRKSP